MTKFTHQNIIGRQTPYTDTNENTIKTIPEILMGFRINQPVFRAYINVSTVRRVEFKAVQYNGWGNEIKTDTFFENVAKGESIIEFKRVRNCESIKVFADGEYIGGIDDEITYTNGLYLEAAPVDYQIYQRGESNSAKIVFAGNIQKIKSDEVMSVNGLEINSTLRGKLICAKFESGNLEKVKVYNVVENQTVDLSDDFTQNDVLKLMLWNSLEEIKPLTNYINLPYENKSNTKIQISSENNIIKETYIKCDENGDFSESIELLAGLYNAKILVNNEIVKEIVNFGVGDVWVAAGQSNMTDMGAITDGFNLAKDDPIIDGMHVMYAENAAWSKMKHPAGEGRFFKTGIRTSPIVSFARILVEEVNVPIGIVQTSVGGTYMYQWASGIRPSDSGDGYLNNALMECFNDMPSKDITGIIWYHGCNDSSNESYAYNYKNLQKIEFSQLREFFENEDLPIITTQINDYNQDEAVNGYYDAFSYLKDVQRQYAEEYENTYVIGTNGFDLGDTVHNNAASNLKVGGAWASVALNRVYGKDEVQYLHPTISKAKITNDREITITFKNIGDEGLYLRTDKKRIGITNALREIRLGDLKNQFIVRQGGNWEMSKSNIGKGETLNLVNAVLEDDKVILTVDTDLVGIVAVDCLYGKRFAPTLTDKKTGWSVLTFYNVIAEIENMMDTELLK